MLPVTKLLTRYRHGSSLQPTLALSSAIDTLLFRIRGSEKCREKAKVLNTRPGLALPRDEQIVGSGKSYKNK